MRILLIEDDPGIISFLKKGLKAEGYSVAVATDGERGLELARYEDIDIAIIDVLLPKKNGLSVVEELRAVKPDMPIVMLSVCSDTETKVRALESGAVDYLTKPFDFDELLARLRVHLNRAAAVPPWNVLEVGDLRLDIEKRRLYRENTSLQLSAREFTLLKYLFHKQEQVLSRQQILNHVWDFNFDPSSNIVDVYIRHLRGKLEHLGSNVTIETVRGMGYRLRCTSDEA